MASIKKGKVFFILIFLLLLKVHKAHVYCKKFQHANKHYVLSPRDNYY